MRCKTCGHTRSLHSHGGYYCNVPECIERCSGFEEEEDARFTDNID